MNKKIKRGNYIDTINKLRVKLGISIFITLLGAICWAFGTQIVVRHLGFWLVALGCFGCIYTSTDIKARK